MKLFLRRQTHKVEFFFCFLTNSVFLKRGEVWVKQMLPAQAFVRNFSHESQRTLLFKFLNNAAAFWNLFWKMVSLSQSSAHGFFTELELVGLGFRIKKITSSLYRFFWGHSNYVYLFVPKTVLVEYSQDERLIFFFSTEILSVNRIVSYLLLLKKLSTYRVTGFVRPGKIIRLNSGKQR